MVQENASAQEATHTEQVASSQDLRNLGPGDLVVWSVHTTLTCRNCNTGLIFGAGNNAQTEEKRKFHTYHTCPVCKTLYILHLQLTTQA